MLKFVASGGQNELVELTVAELLESGGYERSLRQPAAALRVAGRLRRAA